MNISALFLASVLALLLSACGSTSSQVIEEIGDDKVITTLQENKPFLQVLEFEAVKGGIVIGGGVNGCRVDMNAEKTDGVIVHYNGTRCDVMINGAEIKAPDGDESG